MKFQTLTLNSKVHLHLWLRGIVTKWHRITSNVIKAFRAEGIFFSNQNRSYVPVKKESKIHIVLILCYLESKNTTYLFS